MKGSEEDLPTMRTRLAAALAVVVLAPAFSGCLGPNPSVVASAPKKGNGLTVTVSTETGPIRGASDEITYSITYNGEEVYPPPGLETIELDDAGLGSFFVPYEEFVVGNGDYQIHVADGEARTSVDVQKFVEYVFLNPYVEQPEDEEDTFFIDLTLQGSQGGRPQDRVIAKGEAQIDVMYRGENGTKNESAHSFQVITNPDRTFTRTSFPLEEMDQYKGEGYYSVHVSFDNFQARGNFGVGLDPSLRDGDPPRHWVYVEDEEEDDGLLPPPGD